MITAYIDESGTHQGSKILTVAAYVGVLSEWESIELRFKKADKHAGCPFHAVDCANGGGNYRGMDSDKRYRITKKIIKAINDHDVYGIVCGAVIDEYNAVAPQADKKWEKWLQPLVALTFQNVLVDAAVYVAGRYPGEKMSVAMEESRCWYIPCLKKFIRGKHETNWPNHVVLGTMTRYSKSEALQLYAPDVLAYEAYLAKTRELYPSSHGPREHMAALLQKLPSGQMSPGKLLDRSVFEHINDNWGEIATDTHLKRHHKQYAE
jgi:hypothetical protein